MGNISDLSKKKLLHLYHSAFFKLFHIPLDWIQPDDKTFSVCGQDHCNPLCFKIMSSVEGNKMCARQTRLRLQETRNTGKALMNRCHAGFYDLVLPIFDHGEYLGALCAGQFRLSKCSEKEVREISEQLAFLNISPEEVAAYHKSTRHFSREEAEGLQELLQLIADFICDSYGKSKFLASITNSSQIEKVESYIKNHYTQELNIDKLARMTGMSTSYMIHQFTRQNGISPMQYLAVYRIVQAVELLRKSKLDIYEIALAVGFKTVCSFNRAFRKITGVTPSFCRRNPCAMVLEKKKFKDID